MSDSYTHTVALVTLEADLESPVYLTNFDQTLSVDGNPYLPAPEMELDIPVQGGDLSGAEGAIKAVGTSVGVLSNMAGGYPYNQIKVTIREVALDSALAVTDSHILFTGLVYQSLHMPSTGFLEIIIKDWKYYMDTLAGVSCSEQCSVSYFGDGMCQATVQEFPVVVASISGNDVVLSSVPAAVDFLFKAGYFKLNGTSIKIRYWESGNTFQTSEPMPASWAGLAITLVSGCDRMIATCRDIHNNEEHFSGWGINMVDYNAMRENPG